MIGVVVKSHRDRPRIRHCLFGHRLGAIVVLLPMDGVVGPDHQPQTVAFPDAA